MSDVQPDKAAKRRLAIGQIDLARRYDIHAMAGEREVVYEDVRFVALRSIEEPTGSTYSAFAELEGADGGRFLIPQHGIVLICEHGARPPRRVTAGS